MNLNSIFYFLRLTTKSKNCSPGHGTIYTIALENLDNRLRPTPIQLCAALLDPAWCNVPALAQEIENRCSKTRAELLISYVHKYKLDEDGQPQRQSQSAEMEIEISQETGETSRSMNTVMDTRKALLAEFAEPSEERQNLQQVRTLREEVNDYMDAAKSCTWNIEVLKWWGVNEGKFPILSKLARLVLAIPATSAVSESSFSTSGCVITPRRSKISPFNASQILFVHDNFEIVNKFLLSA